MVELQLNDSKRKELRKAKVNAECTEQAIYFARWISEETNFKPTENPNEWKALHMSEGWQLVTTERLWEMFKSGRTYC